MYNAQFCCFKQLDTVNQISTNWQEKKHLEERLSRLKKRNTKN